MERGSYNRAGRNVAWAQMGRWVDAFTHWPCDQGQNYCPLLSPGSLLCMGDWAGRSDSRLCLDILGFTLLGLWQKTLSEQIHCLNGVTLKAPTWGTSSQSEGQSEKTLLRA